MLPRLLSYSSSADTPPPEKTNFVEKIRALNQGVKQSGGLKPWNKTAVKTKNDTPAIPAHGSSVPLETLKTAVPSVLGTHPTYFDWFAPLNGAAVLKGFEESFLSGGNISGWFTGRVKSRGSGQVGSGRVRATRPDP